MKIGDKVVKMFPKFNFPVSYISSSKGLVTTNEHRLAGFSWRARQFDEGNSSRHFREGRKSKIEVEIIQHANSSNEIIHSRGESFCSWMDKPNYRLGVNIALGRALKKAGII